VRKTLRLGFLFVSAALLSPIPAHAYEVSLTPAGNGEEVILVSGEILEDETHEKFLKLVRSSGVKTVSFDSEGGNIMSALELGRTIRKAGLNTYQEQGRECASACSLLFVSGVERSADDETIGVHQAWFDTDSGIDMEEAVSAVQELTADMLTYLIEMGVDPKLMQVSLTTSSDDMHYLSTQQMVDLKVVTSGASTASDDEADVAGWTGANDEQAEELIEEVVERTRERVSGEERIEVRATRSESQKRNVEVRATRRED
jgi:hypothetical protein